jgi:hypothetical protein
VEGNDGKIRAKVGINEWTPAEPNGTSVHDGKEEREGGKELATHLDGPCRSR